jgi:hypothetical protein
MAGATAPAISIGLVVWRLCCFLAAPCKAGQLATRAWDVIRHFPAGTLANLDPAFILVEWPIC